jgi:putative SOS response-associated peptidase YedK
MCGRTSLGVSKSVLENHYQAQMPGSFQPLYNVPPGRELPIVRNEHPELIERAEWGFLPFWMRKRRPRGFINTRVETALEKSSFHQAVLHQRCLVPADGFFEWNASKQPFYFTLKKRDLFSLAGIWEEWPEDDGKTRLTYSVLTTAADERMEKIHDRMPLVLGPEQEKLWLSPVRSEAEARQLLTLRSSLILTSYPVDKRVSSPGFAGREAIVPLG